MLLLCLIFVRIFNLESAKARRSLVFRMSAETDIRSFSFCNAEELLDKRICLETCLLGVCQSRHRCHVEMS